MQTEFSDDFFLLAFQGLTYNLLFRGGNSPRFSIRKIFQLNPELGQKCSEITNKMLKRTKHPIESNHKFDLICKMHECSIRKS